MRSHGREIIESTPVGPDTIALQRVTEQVWMGVKESYWMVVLILGPYRQQQTFGRYTEPDARAHYQSLITLWRKI